MSQVTIETPTGVVAATAQPGDNLFELAENAGVATNGACGGHGACGLCRCQILAGRENLAEPSEEEKNHLGSANFAAGERLACQAVVQTDGDVTVAFSN